MNNIKNRYVYYEEYDNDIMDKYNENTDDKDQPGPARTTASFIKNNNKNDNDNDRNDRVSAVAEWPLFFPMV